MNLQELKYFVAVAEHRHFGRAASACHVSQPTLSGQLRKLEDQLGIALFERTNKKVSLTPAGNRVLVHAKQALQEAELVESVAKAARDPSVGPLKLGIIPIFDGKHQHAQQRFDYGQCLAHAVGIVRAQWHNQVWLRRFLPPGLAFTRASLSARPADDRA